MFAHKVICRDTDINSAGATAGYMKFIDKQKYILTKNDKCILFFVRQVLAALLAPNAPEP